MAWNLLRTLFHRIFSRLSKIWYKGSLPSVAIERNERITRFIFSRDHFTAERAKWNAFQPYRNRTSGRLETSTFRELKLSSADIWRLGREHVEDVQRGRHIKARATGPVAPVLDCGLAFDVNGPPEPIHADIVDWPSEKHEQRQKAMELVGHFGVELIPRVQ